MTAQLSLTLEAVAGGLQVRWRLDGVALVAGEPLARLSLSIAGAPTLDVDGEVVAEDASGLLSLVSSLAEDDGEVVRTWSVRRPTSGPIELAYLAEPVTADPRAATPPLELRAEGGGLSGALKCFVLLPPGPPDAAFELRWIRPGDDAADADSWMAVSSLGELDGADGLITGSGLERLGDTYVMCGDLADRHHRDAELSTWWLTSPGIDVEAFSTRLGATYRMMSEAFDAPAHPYRVFLRTHPHRGANASAHPASFVMALNPAQPLDEASLYQTIAHELVHEWLHLDGPAEDVSWFVEGSADYYSLVLPLRAGMLDEDAFLRTVNLEAREAYASTRRHLSMRAAQRVFFSDFLAHQLPYARGMFYLADLDARLRTATSGQHSVDDVVRDVVRLRQAGERVSIERWCELVEHLSDTDEQSSLDSMVFTGLGRPGSGCFGPRFEHETVQAPVLDLGFDPSTLLTRRVEGLVPDGPAAHAGLREGETLDLPRYPEVVMMNVGDDLQIGVERDGQRAQVSIPSPANRQKSRAGPRRPRRTSRP